MHRTAWLWPSQSGAARLNCLLRHRGIDSVEHVCLLPKHGDQSRLGREECDISVCQGRGLEKVFYEEPYACTIPRSAWQVWSWKLHCVWKSQKNKTKSLKKCSLSPSLLLCSLSLRCRCWVVDALVDCGWGPHGQFLAFWPVVAFCNHFYRMQREVSWMRAEKDAICGYNSKCLGCSQEFYCFRKMAVVT